MRSVIEKKGYAIDVRRLIMGGTFYALNENDADALLGSIYSFVCKHFEKEAVLDWKIDHKALKDWDSAIDNRKSIPGSRYWIQLDGYIKSDIVYNKTTLRKYIHEQMFPSLPLPSPIPEISESEEYKSVSKGIRMAAQAVEKDHSRIKYEIHALYDTEGLIPYGECMVPDIQCFMDRNPMMPFCDSPGKGFINYGNMFCGSFKLLINSYCLDEQVDTWAEELRSFAGLLFQRYKKTNIWIDYNSVPNAIKRVFSENYDSIKSRDELLQVVPSTTFDCIFLDGIGWGNYVSAATCDLGIDKWTKEMDSSVICEELPDGIYVQATGSLSQLRIEDLKHIKEHLYNAFPPCHRVFWRSFYKYRDHFEYIPVLDDELDVSVAGVVFHHSDRRDIDTDLFYNGLGVDSKVMREFLQSREKSIQKKKRKT